MVVFSIFAEDVICRNLFRADDCRAHSLAHSLTHSLEWRLDDDDDDATRTEKTLFFPPHERGLMQQKLKGGTEGRREGEEERKHAEGQGRGRYCGSGGQ